MSETIEQYLKERDYIDPEHVLIAKQAWIASNKSSRENNKRQLDIFLLRRCRTYIYNPFEPYNQCDLYKDLSNRLLELGL
jgi:hypothetical protein